MDSKLSQIVASLSILCGYLYALDIHKYPITTMLDITQYSDSKYSIDIIPPTTKPIYYTPSTTTYDINFSTTNYKTKFGDMVVYDLSNKDRYLNAIAYHSLQIQGDIQKCSLAISDKQLFHQEDNIPLHLDTNASINLNQLYPYIDLSRLKYIVLFKTDPNCYIKHITLHKHKLSQNYNIPQKATWLWDPSIKPSIKKLKKYNIDTIYMQIKKDFNTTTNYLSQNHINIFGLNGSPSDIYDYAHLKQDILYLTKLKHQYPLIKGYQIDVEPYLLPQFKTDKNKVLKLYIDMLKSLQKLCHTHNLKFSVVIPFWYHNIYYHQSNLAKEILKYSDEVVLMSYRSNLQKVLDISKNILAMGELSNKKVSIGIEFMPISDEIHTIYKVISSQVCLTPNGFEKECRTLDKIRSYTIKGDSISFYNQIDKISHIDKLHIPYSSFNGFVLHYYNVLP